MFLYRILEYLSGQTSKGHKKIIPYKVAQGIKVFLLMYIIK